MAALRKHHQDGLFTDVTVQKGRLGRRYKCHRSVLYAASEWFKKALTGGFKVCASPSDDRSSRVKLTSYQESQGGPIHLEDDVEDAITAMIQFCYCAEYDEPATSPMSFHVSMFAMGEKYFIPALQSFAVSRFKHSVATKWNIQDFAEAVRGTYEDTTDSHRLLKTAVIEASVEHEAELFDEDDESGFGVVAPELPNYTFDVLRKTNKAKKRNREVQRKAAVRKFRCQTNGCAGHFVVDRPVVATYPQYFACMTCSRIHMFNDSQAWAKLLLP